ncbi:MAG: hypothetical protein RML37_06430, partial [Chitinophagales bacterium]|nr:hypothetical protein [Chitinophagales bacterium]
GHNIHAGNKTKHITALRLPAAGAEQVLKPSATICILRAASGGSQKKITTIIYPYCYIREVPLCIFWRETL